MGATGIFNGLYKTRARATATFGLVGAMTGAGTGYAVSDNNNKQIGSVIGAAVGGISGAIGGRTGFGKIFSKQLDTFTEPVKSEKPISTALVPYLPPEYKEIPVNHSLAIRPNRYGPKGGISGELLEKKKKPNLGVSYIDSPFVSPSDRKIIPITNGETLNKRRTSEKDMWAIGNGHTLDHGPGTVEVSIGSSSPHVDYELNTMLHDEYGVVDYNWNKINNMANDRMRKYNDAKGFTEDSFQRADIRKSFYTRTKKKYWDK